MKNATLNRSGVGAKRFGRDHDGRVLRLRGWTMAVSVAIPVSGRDVAAWTKPRRPRKRRFSAQFHARNFIGLQHEAHVKLKLVFDVKTHKIAQHAKTPLSRQKTLEV